MNPAITNHQGQAANVQKQNPRMGGCRLQACLRASPLQPEQLKSVWLATRDGSEASPDSFGANSWSCLCVVLGKLLNNEEVEDITSLSFMTY